MTQMDLFEYYTPAPLEKSREGLVKEFHEAFGHPIGNKTLSQETYNLRLKLINEERKELEEAITNYRISPTSLNREQVLKEMADVQYVLSGLAVCLGLDLEEAFIRVHESNMSKLGTDGKPIYRDDGKVLKGPHYAPPYLGDLV